MSDYVLREAARFLKLDPSLVKRFMEQAAATSEVKIL